MSESPLHLKDFRDVVSWVVEELGALCPSQQRLLAWHKNPHDEQLRDVAYHVQEAKCPICQAELDREK